MTVAELIEALQREDPNVRVTIEGCSQCTNDVKRVASGVFRENAQPWVEIEAVLE